MVGINRNFFIREAQARLFSGSMRKSQAVAMLTFIERWEAQFAKSDDRWLAYMLGTTHHETGATMQPVRETFASSDERVVARLESSFRAGKLIWVKTPYWRKDSSGKSWYGRGYVQLTHRENYEKVGRAIGQDLVSNPDKALEPATALEIIFAGMIRGLFVHQQLLERYFSQVKEDWRGARRIINGTERADLVADYARRYYGCISYTVG